jgi:carboxymethylenebutenolidase
MEIRTERVEIPLSGGGSMGGYVARPDDYDDYPSVIVYMEIFGINSHIRDVTERVASEGYVAIAPDYFHRTGPGIELGYDDDGMAEGMKHLGQLQADQMISDAQDTIRFIKGLDGARGDRIGCMGFCIGGHMTYLTACETEVMAAASYYGGGIAGPAGPGGGAPTVSRTAGIKGRINCYFGGQDAMIPEDQVKSIRSALADAGVAHQVKVYDPADHGFHCNQRPTYHEESAQDAWGHTKQLFDEVLNA